MNQNERKTVARRMILLIAVACVIMGLYVMRLIFLQLVNGDDFKAKATNTTDYNFTVTAARGDIVDSAGRRIATTPGLSFCTTMRALYSPVKSTSTPLIRTMRTLPPPSDSPRTVIT